MTDEKTKNENLENTNLEQNDTPKESKEEKTVEKTETKEKTETAENKAGEKETKSENSDKKDFKGRRPFDKNKKFGNRRGNFRKPFRREKPEFEQKILSLRRVTRVMAGGRRFSFSVAVVVGDKKGRVGIGLGKSNDTTMAIDKAVRNAKKNMVKITLKNGSVPYDVSAKYKASEVNIRPVKGKGLAAGGAVRTVLEYAGVKEAGAKLLTRSKNHINNARATVIALSPFSEKVEVSLQKEDRRGNQRNRRGGRFNKKGGFNKGGKPFGRKPFVKRDDQRNVKPEEKTEKTTETVENNSNK